MKTPGARTPALVALALVASQAVSCATNRGRGEPASGLRGPSVEVPRPARCDLDVAADGPLAPTVAGAPAGAVLCLQPGRHEGPLEIRKALTVWGPRDAIVHSNGVGTTIDVRDTDHVRLMGFTVDGSGSRYDTEDAAVAIRKCDDVRVESLVVERATFGILVEQSNELRILNNQVLGDANAPLGLRGDGIRMWEVRKSLVQGNHVQDSRDVVIWYSPGNHVLGNTVERSRYGTHLMYSHGNELSDNTYRSNVVGIFSMYSRDLKIHRNLFLDSSGAGGMGLGAKEAGALDVRDNVFVHNESAVYLDTTPLVETDEDVFAGNAFVLGGAGVTFLGRASGNRFLENGFTSNRRQVVVEGGGDALAARWDGNYFDDYQGYDLDGDGRGDVPYQIQSLSEQLAATHPSLQLFRGTPALGVVEALGRLVPLFAPQLVVEDPSPSMSDPTHERLHAY
ncbi:MAG: nitrous oxide reductase family maturation protein NosD [Myxococcales bacterium]|nr:nitrous oxide reductase family maturation protein NosD [Myxococcales bacterium]